jgi:hypothetical protein
MQLGTTANNASGSLLLTNLTASGTVTVGGGLNLTNTSGPTVTLSWAGNDRSGSVLLNGNKIQGQGIRPSFDTYASTVDGAQPDFGAFNANGTIQYFGLYKKSGTAGVMQVKSDSSTFASVELGNLTASGDINLTGRIVYASSGVPFLRCSSSNVAAVFNNVLRHIQLRGGGEGGLTWASGSDPSGVASSGITQIGAAHLAIGNGTADSTAGSLSLTNLTASGTLRVGGGTVVASILSATATLDFGSIGSNGTETLTITVTGAVAGDSVFLGCPAGLDAGLIFCASVTAADTVTVRMHNSSGGSTDPASGTFRATVIRF